VPLPRSRVEGGAGGDEAGGRCGGGRTPKDDEIGGGRAGEARGAREDEAVTRSP
jgi:hypothetical protein